MRRLLLILVMLCALPSWGTIALGQHPSKTTCGAAASCAITITSPTAGDLLVGVMHQNSHTVTISSVSGACSGSWVVSSASYTTDLVNTGIEGEFAYCLSAAAGTSVTFTWSATSGSVTAIDVFEFSHAGTMSFDVAGIRDQSTSVSSMAGVTLTLTGASDVIMQLDINNASNPTAISSPYSFQNVNGDGIGWSLNTASGTAPTWTKSGPDASALAAIAFTEVVSSTSRKRVMVTIQ